MSFTAYVAFETEAGYDIHRSHNGGEQYMLRQILEAYVDDEVNRTASELPQMFTASVGTLAAELGLDASQFGEGQVIADDPLAVNVEKQDIPSRIPVFDTEVLYVVEEETVKTYIPVNPSATTLDALQRMASIDLYKLGPAETHADVMNNEQREPDVILRGDVLTPQGIDALPEWAQTTVEQGHRYFANHCMVLQKTGESKRGIVLNDVLAATSLKDPEEAYRLANAGLPIRVHFEDGTPSYPMYLDRPDAVGALPKVVTSRVRYNLYPVYYKRITEYDGPMQGEGSEQFVEHMRPVHEKMLQSICDNFGDDIDTDYVGDVMTERIHEASTDGE